MVFAAKEVEEETGLLVRPVRLLALLDKRKHAHPPQPWYTYKGFIQCEVRGGASADRTTPSQLQTMLTLASDPHSAALCD